MLSWFFVAAGLENERVHPLWVPATLPLPFTRTEGGSGTGLTTSPQIHVCLETQDVPPLQIQSLKM